MLRSIVLTTLLGVGLSASAQGFAPIKLTYLNPADGRITIIKNLMFASEQIIVSDPDGVEVAQTGRVIAQRVILTELPRAPRAHRGHLTFAHLVVTLRHIGFARVPGARASRLQLAHFKLFVTAHAIG